MLSRYAVRGLPVHSRLFSPSVARHDKVAFLGGGGRTSQPLTVLAPKVGPPDARGLAGSYGRKHFGTDCKACCNVEGRLGGFGGKAKYALEALEQLAQQEEEDDAVFFRSMELYDVRDRFNITFCHFMLDRGDHEDRAAWSVAQGGEKYMSSKDMYRHLNFLENLVSKTNRVGTQLWVDTIFFRVSAMLPTNQSMVLRIGQDVSPAVVPTSGQRSSVKVASGMVDYVAVMADHSQHKKLMTYPRFTLLTSINLDGLIVVKTEQRGELLTKRLPQVLVEMYTSAKDLKKKIIRGAITNGHEWVFLIFYLNEDGNGGSYSESPLIKFRVSDGPPYSVLPPEPDVVAGILAYWIQHSSVGLDENDWFCPIGKKSENEAT